MHQASFVRLNDDKTGADECGYWEGPKCGRHTLELTSEVDQTVWITAHTWDARTLPENCQTMEGVHQVLLDGQEVNDSNYWDISFSSGSLELAPM